MPELRNTNHYADQVARRYPQLDIKAVRRVCRYVMRKVAALALRDEDVLLQSSRYQVKFKIYKLEKNARKAFLKKADKRMARARLRAKRQHFFGSGTLTNNSAFPLKTIR